MDKMTYQVSVLEEGRVRITVSIHEVELGVLYFEKAKKGFINKPIGMNGWACVDAKVEGLYVHGGEDITPKDIVAHCQSLLREGGY